jgi:hypothetical protein
MGTCPGRAAKIRKTYKILIICPILAYRSFMRRRLFKDADRARKDEVSMLDILFIGIGLGFLAGAMLYAVACDRL